MNLLHLDSSILGAASASRAISAAVVSRLTANKPGIALIYRDLAAAPLSHLSGAYLAARNTEATPDQAQPEDILQGGAALDEFLAANTVVIGVPMYNFAIPSQLKAWIDRICVAGKTFRYTDSGPVGLAGDKRVVLAISRGGLYGPGAPAAAVEHAESYLRAIFGFLGVTQIETVRAEGLALGPEQQAKSLEAAIDEAGHLLAA